MWLDMEMTGLDPRRNQVIEIAAVVTEIADLTPFGSYHAVIHQPDAVIDTADAFVRDMHTRSGLWDHVRASTTSLEEAEKGALDLVAGWCEPRQGILAGNSIWQDRRFLFVYMPRLEAYLHYRQVDVSTLKVLAGAWFGQDAIPKKSEKHTALGDIHESIAELQHYRSLMTPAEARVR